MQQFSMLVPQEFTISNNRSSPIWLRKRVKDGITELTRTHARGLTPVGKATIYVGITKRTKIAYDPVNLSDSMKPCVDAMVRMGILDEDNYHHVLGPFLWHKGVDKRIPKGHMRATVTLTDYSPVPF